jgi:hypothetical protein
MNGLCFKYAVQNVIPKSDTVNTINFDRITSTDKIAKQSHSTGEILCKPANNKINEDISRLYLPAYLEAHIIALIKEGLS